MTPMEARSQSSPSPTTAGDDLGRTAASVDRFWHAETPRARPGSSGLGLAIVHGLVDAKHGQIRLDAAVPGGLLTEIRLPLAPEHTPFPA